MQPRPFDDSAVERVLGVLAGDDMPLPLLGRWAASSSLVLAADAGLDRLLDAGHEPDLVVGDLDSSAAHARFPGRLMHDASEEWTDTDKLLAVAVLREVRQITLASLEGDQIDHMLATLHSALRAPLSVRLALRTGIAWVMKAGESRVVSTEPGRRVSLLPLEPATGVSLSGVQWPLEGVELEPSGRTSISNRAVEPLVSASIETGSALLVVNYPEEELPVW